MPLFVTNKLILTTRKQKEKTEISLKNWHLPIIFVVKKIRISIIKLKDLFQFLVFITEISLYFGKLLEKTEFTLKIYVMFYFWTIRLIPSKNMENESCNKHSTTIDWFYVIWY